MICISNMSYLIDISTDLYQLNANLWKFVSYNYFFCSDSARRYCDILILASAACLDNFSFSEGVRRSATCSVFMRPNYFFTPCVSFFILQVKENNYRGFLRKLDSCKHRIGIAVAIPIRLLGRHFPKTLFSRLVSAV